MPKAELFSQPIADEICERLASGETLLSICKDEHIPSYSTVGRWVMNDSHGFRAQYIVARMIQAEHRVDEIFEMVDDKRGDILRDKNGLPLLDDNGNPVYNLDHIKRVALQVDARKWFASKAYAKVYGNSPDIMAAAVAAAQKFIAGLDESRL